jgi:hypothetical protein
MTCLENLYFGGLAKVYLKDTCKAYVRVFIFVFSSVELETDLVFNCSARTSLRRLIHFQPIVKLPL